MDYGTAASQESWLADKLVVDVPMQQHHEQILIHTYSTTVQQGILDIPLPIAYLYFSWSALTIADLADSRMSSTSGPVRGCASFSPVPRFAGRISVEGLVPLGPYLDVISFLR
jgi:hypothetical protein